MKNWRCQNKGYVHSRNMLENVWSKCGQKLYNVL